MREVPSQVVTGCAVFGDTSGWPAFPPGRRSGCGRERRGVCGKRGGRGNCRRDVVVEKTIIMKIHL